MKKKRGWPKGKKRGPRIKTEESTLKQIIETPMGKMTLEQYLEATRVSQQDPFKIRSVPNKSEQPISDVLSPYYGRMSKVETLLLLDILKRAIEASIK